MFETCACVARWHLNLPSAWVRYCRITSFTPLWRCQYHGSSPKVCFYTPPWFEHWRRKTLRDSICCAPGAYSRKLLCWRTVDASLSTNTHEGAVKSASHTSCLCATRPCKYTGTHTNTADQISVKMSYFRLTYSGEFNHHSCCWTEEQARTPRPPSLTDGGVGSWAAPSFLWMFFFPLLRCRLSHLSRTRDFTPLHPLCHSRCWHLLVRSEEHFLLCLTSFQKYLLP